jgi:signal-transduction protein with cAMP-binding, CBS, and nucleotidyltransferase domain
MKRKTLEKGSFIYKRDDESQEMYLIQSGMIEIYHYTDKKEQNEFVIERLYRGSIINHNSFLMNDELDTDARCASNVTVFYIDINHFKNLRSKHIVLDQIMDTHEAWLVGGNRKEPAIDYIIQSPFNKQYFKVNKQTGEKVYDYKKEMYRRKLTFKLKNAILVVLGSISKKKEI